MQSWLQHNDIEMYIQQIMKENLYLLKHSAFPTMRGKRIPAEISVLFTFRYTVLKIFSPTLPSVTSKKTSLKLNFVSYVN